MGLRRDNPLLADAGIQIREKRNLERLKGKVF